MKRRTEQNPQPKPQYVCKACGVKDIREKTPVRIGSTKEFYCPICQKKTEHVRVG